MPRAKSLKEKRKTCVALRRDPGNALSRRAL